MIVAEGSSESISSIPYTSLSVDFVRNMTSGRINLTHSDREAGPSTKVKGKEKILATSSKKGVSRAENPKVVVGSEKSINLLFS
jgi:hypothetical protein